MELYPTPDFYKKEIRSINRDRYFSFYDPYHPLAGKTDGMVYLHRHLASVKIGRWLTHEENVHHIDGNKENNDLDNLMILTNENHIKIHMNENGKSKVIKNCIICGKEFECFNKKKKQKKFCSPECSQKSQRIRERPPCKEIIKRVSEQGYLATGRMFKVSGNTIKKWIKSSND